MKNPVNTGANSYFQFYERLSETTIHEKWFSRVWHRWNWRVEKCRGELVPLFIKNETKSAAVKKGGFCTPQKGVFDPPKRGFFGG